MSGTPTVGVVILGWQEEPWLLECVRAVTASTGVEVDVVIIDNGITSTLPAEITGGGVRIIKAPRNLGFAGGCNFGATQVAGDYLALVNSDAMVLADTLSKLVHSAAAPHVAMVSASIRLAEDPDLLNSAGNPVHVLGLCWAGGLGEHERRTGEVEVPTGSGACLLMRRASWDALDGFDEEYFAYLEDTELSLRAWRRGDRVLYRPDAIALHHYEFSRNPTKMYLLERNRLLLLSTMWSIRSLLLLTPPLLALELAMALVAAKQGWLKEKVRGWVWIVKHLSHIRTRRRVLQSERVVPDSEWMRRLTPLLSTTVIELPAATAVLNILMRGWWGVVRRLV